MRVDMGITPESAERTDGRDGTAVADYAAADDPPARRDTIS